MDGKLSKEWLKQNGHKLKIVYSYALVHKYNIESNTDVLAILRVVDPKNATEAYAEIFTKMLQLFRNRLRKTLGEKIEG